jgi:hypothetical protein
MATTVNDVDPVASPVWAVCENVVPVIVIPNPALGITEVTTLFLLSYISLPYMLPPTLIPPATVNAPSPL